MNAVDWIGVVGAVVTGAIIIAFLSTGDGAREAFLRWLQSWGPRIIQIWIFVQSGVVIVRFFQGSGAPSREDIGFLLVSIFNCMAWGFFIARMFIEFLKRRL